LGFKFGAGAVVLIFVEVELDFAAEVEGVLEAGEFAHQVLQTEGTFVGIFEALERSEALADFEEEEAAHGFEGVVAAIMPG
jgi:hypothetical protein